MSQRSKRLPTVSSPLTLLSAADPLRQAIVREMAGLAIDGPHYAALERAMAALDTLAADLGHEGRFRARAP